MAKAVVTVLYEDQRGQRQQGFGLHMLVKACVFDAINGQRRWLEEEALKDFRPLKGAPSLLRACREEIELIAPDGHSVVAVFDNDQIRRLLALPRNATAARVEQEIRKGCRASSSLFIVLLEQNTESVIKAAAKCDPTIDKKRVERAVKQKEPLDRDAILSELSRERSRPVRDCILRELSSFRTLINLLCSKVRPS
jgi:hypothetical protein